MTQQVVAAEDVAEFNGGDISQHTINSLPDNPAPDWLLSSRIIGGRDAPANSWPSLVALVTPGTANVKDRFFCGATLVAERWVLTAAHCLFSSQGLRTLPSQLRVIEGIRNLANDVPEEEISVTNIVIHPQYNNRINVPPFDIALLELGSALNAPVVNLFAGDPATRNGTTSYIAGWGAIRYIDENNATYPSQLQDASLPIVPLARCNSIISYQGLITHRQICAGLNDGGIDSCAGDSGGPLFIIEDGEIIQLGITSYGNGCALPNFYGVYTSVSHLIPWLSNYIDVPAQSPELAARLDSGAPLPEPEPDPDPDPITLPEPIADKDSGFFGALNPLSGIVLLLYWSLRRRRAH
jgi:secreted trypsin-like serine protease